MRTVLVAGFFNPVLEKLQEQFASELARGTIVWIAQYGQHGAINLRQFKERLNCCMSAGSAIFVLLAELRGRDYTLADLRSIIAAGQERWPAAVVTTETLRDPGAVKAVVERISQFGIPETAPNQITMEFLHRKLSGKAVLCIRETNHTSFRKALQRAGFPIQSWGTIFQEEIVNHGKLPSFISGLHAHSSSYGRILYAWHGLKYLGDRSELKCPIQQAGDVRAVIDRFKEWLSEEEA